MYENNDLYNLNLDMYKEQAEPTTVQEGPVLPKQPAEPKQPEPKEQEPAEHPTNKSANPEQTGAQDSPQAKAQLSEEQIAYIERARQRDELERVVNDIKSRIPSFDMEAISKELLKMKDDEVSKYYNPQGLELLWYERFAGKGTANNPPVDGSHTSSSGISMDELAKKIVTGTATMDEEREYYIRMGKIGQSDY